MTTDDTSRTITISRDGIPGPGPAPTLADVVAAGIEPTDDDMRWPLRMQAAAQTELDSLARQAEAMDVMTGRLVRYLNDGDLAGQRVAVRLLVAHVRAGGKRRRELGDTAAVRPAVAGITVD